MYYKINLVSSIVPSLHPVCNESWVQNGISSSQRLNCLVILFHCLHHSLPLAHWILYQYHDHNTVSNVSLVEAHKLMYVEYPASTMYDCNVLSTLTTVVYIVYSISLYADIITAIVSLSSQPVSPPFSEGWGMGWLDGLNINSHASTGASTQSQIETWLWPTSIFQVPP